MTRARLLAAAFAAAWSAALVSTQGGGAVQPTPAAARTPESALYGTWTVDTPGADSTTWTFAPAPGTGGVLVSVYASYPAAQPNRQETVALVALDDHTLARTSATSTTAAEHMLYEVSADGRALKVITVPDADPTKVAVVTLRRRDSAPSTAAAPAATPAAAASTNPADRLPAGEGKQILLEKCGVCHEAERPTRMYRDQEGWAELIDSMVRRGAVLSDEEKTKLRDYLFEHWGIK